jgi:hypothetical protein
MEAKIDSREGVRGPALHKAQRATSKAQDNRLYYTSTVLPIQIRWSALRVRIKHAHIKPANPSADSKEEEFQCLTRSPDGSDISVIFSGIGVRHGVSSIAPRWCKPKRYVLAQTDRACPR